MDNLGVKRLLETVKEEEIVVGGLSTNEAPAELIRGVGDYLYIGDERFWFFDRRPFVLEQDVSPR